MLSLPVVISLVPVVDHKKLIEVNLFIARYKTSWI